MKRIIPPLVCLFIGFGAGWYFGYTRPAARNQRELIRQYQYVRDNFHMTDAQMVDFGAHQQEYFAAIKREDEMAALIALAALAKLDQGDLDMAKGRLQTAISIYYRGHSFDGDSNLLRHITDYAATNAPLSNAIYRKLE
jgi:hypothetical protein